MGHTIHNLDDQKNKFSNSLQFTPNLTQRQTLEFPENIYNTHVATLLNHSLHPEVFDP